MTSDLATEIKTDPTGLGYAGKSLDEILAMLRAPTRDRLRPLTPSDLLDWAAKDDRMTMMEESTGNASRVLLRRFSIGLDFGNLAQAALVQSAVDDGTFKAEDKDELVVLATEKISRLEELGLPQQDLGDVKAAKG